MRSPSATSPKQIRVEASISESRLPASARHRNIPWIVLGVLIVASSALAFTVWAERIDERHPALALATDVRAGEVITSESLTTVRISSDIDVGSVDPADLARIVGRVAMVDLPAGTLAIESLLADQGLLPPGRALVGIPAQRIDLPVGDLRPGDALLVIEIPADPSAADSRETERRVWPAHVFSTEDVVDDVGATTVVSLDVEAASAPDIAAAAARGVRLVLVSNLDDGPSGASEASSDRSKPRDGSLPESEGGPSQG